MLWVVRWTDNDGKDTAAVFEAGSAAEAHYMAARRGIAVVVVEEASEADVKAAIKSGKIWRYSAQPKYTCMGQPVGRFQLACLLICGILTGVLLAQPAPQHGGLISKVAGMVR
jgi:hypothetical protein